MSRKFLHAPSIIKFKRLHLSETDDDEALKFWIKFNTYESKLGKFLQITLSKSNEAALLVCIYVFLK